MFNSKNKYVSKAYFDENLEEDEESIGQKLIELIKKSNEYTEMINNKECMSIITGIIIGDLISTCGCSMEKLPLIVESVLNLLFGKIDSESINLMIRSSSTYNAVSQGSDVIDIDKTNIYDWNITSTTHAYPGVSMYEYEKIITDSFINAK